MRENNNHTPARLSKWRWIWRKHRSGKLNQNKTQMIKRVDKQEKNKTRRWRRTKANLETWKLCNCRKGSIGNTQKAKTWEKGDYNLCRMIRILDLKAQYKNTRMEKQVESVEGGNSYTLNICHVSIHDKINLILLSSSHFLYLHT